MTDSGQSEKKALRREKRLLRESLSACERAVLDRVILERIGTLREFSAASAIAGYATDGSEPDILPLLEKAVRAGKTVCLPRRKDGSDYEMAVFDGVSVLAAGRWNIPEPGAEAPSAPRELLQNAFWLVPGVAFDESCARLGRGKGVYDRMLAEIRGPSAGIFYECQKAETLPLEKHDRRLDMIVTEHAVYRAVNNK